MSLRMTKLLGAILAVLLTFPLLAWAALALRIDGPSSQPLAVTLSLGFVGLSLGVLVFVRPFVRAYFLFLVGFLLVLAWWLGIEPRNDRDWIADVARLPRAEISGNRVTIHNLRNFDYSSETDVTPHWETRTFDLNQLVGVDMFLSFWGPTLIAHTIASWEFADGQHLAISIETRKEVGESYSALLGFFRQYELYYVVADERDVVRLRTNYRGEKAYLYRMKAAPQRARAILLDYLEEVNRLTTRPAWYNALTHNCTTTIRHHAQNVTPGNPWNWRLLVNGRLDELGYMRGTIDTSLPLEELRRRSDVTERARAAGNAADFSARIRAGLPGAR
jgi:hypothetical protein